MPVTKQQVAEYLSRKVALDFALSDNDAPLYEKKPTGRLWSTIEVVQSLIERCKPSDAPADHPINQLLKLIQESSTIRLWNLAFKLPQLDLDGAISNIDQWLNSIGTTPSANEQEAIKAAYFLLLILQQDATSYVRVVGEDRLKSIKALLTLCKRKFVPTPQLGVTTQTVPTLETPITPVMSSSSSSSTVTTTSTLTTTSTTPSTSSTSSTSSTAQSVLFNGPTKNSNIQEHLDYLKQVQAQIKMSELNGLNLRDYKFLGTKLKIVFQKISLETQVLQSQLRPLEEIRNLHYKFETTYNGKNFNKFWQDYNTPEKFKALLLQLGVTENSAMGKTLLEEYHYLTQAPSLGGFFSSTTMWYKGMWSMGYNQITYQNFQGMFATLIDRCYANALQAQTLDTTSTSQTSKTEISELTSADKIQFAILQKQQRIESLESTNKRAIEIYETINKTYATKLMTVQEKMEAPKTREQIIKVLQSFVASKDKVNYFTSTQYKTCYDRASHLLNISKTLSAETLKKECDAIVNGIDTSTTKQKLVTFRNAYCTLFPKQPDSPKKTAEDSHVTTQQFSASK